MTGKAIERVVFNSRLIIYMTPGPFASREIYDQSKN
jgi:hypothetical protein